MGSISQMTNEGASAWLTWSANLMTAIGTAIPAIEALIAAKKAESIGNAVASATQTPVVGWLLAGAAVASVIAAFATMPQFANGGVVDGSSFFGDKILARVNSGEMILNKKSAVQFVQPVRRWFTCKKEVLCLEKLNLRFQIKHWLEF